MCVWGGRAELYYPKLDALLSYTGDSLQNLDRRVNGSNRGFSPTIRGLKEFESMDYVYNLID